MIRDGAPGWTPTARWCRWTSRTAAGGTAAGSPRGLQRLQLAAGATGPYLPQAVIAAVHATAPSWEQTDWATICAAYDRLIEIADSPVARANRALAIGFRDGFAAGLAALDEVADDPRLARSSTVPSIRADLLRRAGRTAEALDWYRIALERNGSEPAREFLRRRIANVEANVLTPSNGQLTGTSRIGRPTSAPGPSKCHHSPEYTVNPPALIPSRSHALLACCCALMPSVANAFAAWREVVEVGSHVDQPAVVPSASVTSTERPVSWLRANAPGRATQFGSGTASNIRTWTACGR